MSRKKAKGKGRGRRGKKARKVGFFQRWRRRVAILAVLAVAGGAAAALVYRHHVVAHPGAHLERDWILAAISQESPVFYRDGNTKIGVFFDEQHRQYVPYDDIPPAFVHALVASEDKSFFEHHGFDGSGIGRAMLHNIQAGKVVEGGSTLTQQTAENLFYARRAFTWRDKAHEALDSLRLEHHYTKEDILEFYSNQFYVNGNGRGLGIAARYFFDKDVGQLDTLECAFLAGVVQSPSRFDPFIGDTAEKRTDARARSRKRTAYVLGRMLEEGYITADDHAALAERDIPFERGRFRYPYGVVLDAVARELDSEQFLDVLQDHGIDNPSTAGIEIVTTLDAHVQTEALYGLLHHLTEVGIPLEGVGLDDVVEPSREIRPVSRADIRRHTCHWGKVVAVDPQRRTLEVDLGGTRGLVDVEGTTRLATLLKRSADRNRWAQASASETTATLRRVSKGDILWVSVREEGDEGLLLDVEHLTELQGGVVALDDGEILAMVGGNRNRDFNRAVQARRQFGSTFKPLVYYAALQLGWTVTDVLDNRRDVFPFEGSFYFPRPDHENAPDDVSLAWAGVHSENLASVWLLYHLTEHLNEAQFQEVAGLAGLTRGRGAGRAQYIERKRAPAGIVPTGDRIREGVFDVVREDVRVDLQFDGRADELATLDRLHYGLKFADERARQREADRRALLETSFLSLLDDAQGCRRDLGRLRSSTSGEAESLTFAPVAGWYAGMIDGRLALSCGEGGDGWAPLKGEQIGYLAGRGELEQALADEAVLVRGSLSLATLEGMAQEIESRASSMEDGDLYTLSTLGVLRDFRTLVAIRYVIALARQMGVESELATGMSLPLGSSEVTLLELALMYQAMRDGRTVTFGEEQRPTAIILEIRLKDGTVVYRAEGQRHALTEGAAPEAVGQVLRNVVLRGTGRQAAAAFPEVPLAGKTGTTNSYRNAAFAGIVPRPVKGGWSLGDGVVVASYVGYDDNRKMARGSIRLAGATGSLPAWLGAVQGVTDRFEAPDGGPHDLVLGRGLEAVVVDPTTGLPIQAGADGVTLYRVAGSGGQYGPFEPR